MKEDFVSYELAVKLKEKGYPQRTLGNYNMVDACYFEDGRFYKEGCIACVEDCFSAPTISQVLKWLREEKHIAINITFIPVCWQFTVLPMSFNKNRFKLSGKTFYFRYEQAALAGIEYVLDNLKLITHFIVVPPYYNFVYICHLSLLLHRIYFREP